MPLPSFLSLTFMDAGEIVLHASQIVFPFLLFSNCLSFPFVLSLWNSKPTWQPALPRSCKFMHQESHLVAASWILFTITIQWIAKRSRCVDIQRSLVQASKEGAVLLFTDCITTTLEVKKVLEIPFWFLTSSLSLQLATLSRCKTNTRQTFCWNTHCKWRKTVLALWQCCSTWQNNLSEATPPTNTWVAHSHNST